MDLHRLTSPFCEGLPNPFDQVRDLRRFEGARNECDLAHGIADQSPGLDEDQTRARRPRIERLRQQRKEIWVAAQHDATEGLRLFELPFVTGPEKASVCGNDYVDPATASASHDARIHALIRVDPKRHDVVLFHRLDSTRVASLQLS